MINSLHGIPLLRGSKSQMGQESFVFYVLEEKHEGYYIEIGAFDAFELSNTLILEKNGWQGVAVDIVPELVTKYNEHRKNKCILADATKLDYEMHLDSISAPKVIDFLQIDIDPPRNSFKALLRVLRASRRFRAVIFEHDLYSKKFGFIPHNLFYKLAAIIILRSRGYILLASNVKNVTKKQEDWFLHKLDGGLNFTKVKNIDYRSLFHD